MNVNPRSMALAAIFLLGGIMAYGEELPLPPSPRTAQPRSIALVYPSPSSRNLALETVDLPRAQLAVKPAQPLFDFHESDIKFRVATLMSLLRDKRHEGWVLSAYPDPKTRRPLIGAGFSLDVQAGDHPQSDPFNTHTFAEPSSAQLWQAAGLDPLKLQRILNTFDRSQKAAARGTRRRKNSVRRSPAQLTDEEATRLLRISAIQAISNARAYCRHFDQLTGAQQMALSQLVFQMGVNLEQFVQFLGELNTDFSSELAQLDRPAESSAEWNRQHWMTVQSALIDSQWARLYTGRASTVIAMFDPDYLVDPSGAQQRTDAQLYSTPPSSSSQRPVASTRTASYRSAALHPSHKAVRSTRRKRKA